MSGNFAIKGGGVGPLMANAILNFHFDFLHTSLIDLPWSYNVLQSILKLAFALAEQWLISLNQMVTMYALPQVLKVVAVLDYYRSIGFLEVVNKMYHSLIYYQGDRVGHSYESTKIAKSGILWTKRSSARLSIQVDESSETFIII